ncbi:phospholipase A and acyltransferase 4-like [Stigmatopora nigra]
MPSEQEPKKGDLIEIDRSGYQHWAIYVGDDYVVHLAPASEVPDAGIARFMSVTTDVALVKKEKLSKVAGDCSWKIKNLLDDKYQPKSVAIILKDVNEQIGRRVGYSIMSRNCEHFVTDMRYGKAESRQVRQVATAATVATVGVVGVVTAAAMVVARYGLDGAPEEEDENGNSKEKQVSV